MIRYKIFIFGTEIPFICTSIWYMYYLIMGEVGDPSLPKSRENLFFLAKICNNVTLTPSGHEFHHLCWPQDLVLLPVTRVLRFWKTGGGVILLLRLSPHLIGGIVLCQNGHDGPQFHPPLRFRWSPVKERWSLVIRHQQINVDWGGQWAPKIKVGDVLNVRNRLELVGSRPHPQ